MKAEYNLVEDFKTFHKISNILNNQNWSVEKKKRFLFLIVASEIPIYILDKILNTLCLHSFYDVLKLKDITETPHIDTEVVNFKKTDDEIFNQILDKFTNFFECYKGDLNFFYHNLKNLTIKNQEIESTLYNETVGRYKSFENEISYIKNAWEELILHEVFHMSSTIHKKDKIYSGFKQVNPDVGYAIGEGLNEGYTTVLAKRYSMEQCNTNSYYYESKVALGIENIIGENKMTSLYLNANLLGLIKELKTYDTTSNIMKFIHYLDFYRNYSHYKLYLPTKNKKLTNCQNFIDKFIIRNTIQKLSNDVLNITLNNKDISVTEDIKLKLEDIMNNLCLNNSNRLMIKKYVKEYLGYDIEIESNKIIKMSNGFVRSRKRL